MSARQPPIRVPGPTRIWDIPASPSARMRARRRPREYQADGPSWQTHPALLELYRPLDVAVASLGLLAMFAGVVSPSASFVWPAVLGVELRLSSVLLLGAFLATWHASFAAVELYDGRRLRTWRDEAQRLLAGTLPGTALLTAYLALQPGVPNGRLFTAAAAFWSVTYLGTLASRVVLRQLLPAGSQGGRRVVILGSGPRAQHVRRTLDADPGGHEVLGFVDSRTNGVPADVDRHTLGRLEDLESLLMHNVVDEVVIALPVKSQYTQIQHAIRTCERMGVDARYLADVFDWDHTPAELDDTPALASVTLRAVSRDYRRRIKRSIDFAVGLTSLILFAPFMALIALAIRLQDGGPVFFIQWRHGLNKRGFRMIKFRTMVPGAEAMQADLEAHNEANGAVFKMRRDPRVTRVGALLRRTSLDELPQLFNVLAGDMSIVGPRPLPARDVSHFDGASAMRRFSVRPGMTGLWQVSGRSDLDFDELVALDLHYIDKWSLWLDLKIVLRTVGAVWNRRGAR